MKDLQHMPDTYYIFGALIGTVNKLDTLLERELKQYGVTSRQWLMTIIIDNLFEQPPTIKEVAKEMVSSHQNIKQMALKLQEKGLLRLEKDKKDARATRLMLTEQSRVFWKQIEPRGAEFMELVFKEIGAADLAKTREVITRIMMNLTELENKDEEEKE